MVWYKRQKFVDSISDVQGAILISCDGLTLASVLPTEIDEELTAVISTSRRWACQTRLVISSNQMGSSPASYAFFHAISEETVLMVYR